MFDRPPLWNGSSDGIKNYGIKVSFSEMKFMLNFMGKYQLFQNLLVGARRQRDSLLGNIIKLTLFLKESRLKKRHIL
jgi:hypothetical protein